MLYAVEAAAQLPVRTRQLQLISNNNTNYTAVEAVDGQTTNWSLILPPTEGADYSLLYSDVTGTDASLTWLAPGTAGYFLTSGGPGAPPSWTDPGGTYWSLLGNGSTNPLTNFLGTTDVQPLVIRTNNVERLRVNATGEVGIGTSASGGYLLHVSGVQGTPNVRLQSVSGVTATSTIPAGFDRFVVANASGDLGEVAYSSVVSQSAWVLAGNAPTASWNGVTGSFLGTTNAQPLSIATTNAVAQDINVYTGASGANLRMTIEGDGDIIMRGTAGTPNVTLESVGGAAAASLPVGYDRVLIANNTGLVSQASASAIVNSSAWTLTGNTGTTAFNGVTGNYIGTNDTQDWVWVTNGVFRARLVGGAVNTGNLVLGTTTASPTNTLATAATDRLTILGGDLSFDSENSSSITRQILFRGTAGGTSGRFRIGSDGGDIAWQGGGGQMLQMASYWGIQLVGNRGVGGAPAFAAGAASDASVNIIGTRTTAPILVTTPPAGLTANQQEWRSSAGAALSVVDANGNVGLGITTGLAAKLHINAASTTGNAIQLDPWGIAAENTGQIRFMELAAGGTNYAAFRAADAMDANNIYTLPATIGTAGQVLSIQAVTGTNATLQWATAGTSILEEVTASQGNIRRRVAFTNGTVGTPGQFATDLMGSRSATTQTASGTYAGILAGSNNTASGSYSLVLGGQSNTASANYSLVLGGQSNSVSGTYSMVFGYGAAVTQNNSIVFNHPTVGDGETRVGIDINDPQTSLDIDGGLVIRAPATVAINANNATLTVGNRSYIVLDPNGGNRTGLILSNGLQAGQILILRIIETAGNFIGMPDAAASNVNLTGNWVGRADDTITLIWSGVDWVETSRSNN